MSTARPTLSTPTTTNSPGTTDIGGLPFIYDTKSFLNFGAGLKSDPRSDGAAISHLLEQHNEQRHLAFPKNVARIRVFHLPTPDRRTELMIIYGESLPADSKIPATTEGSHLNESSPESANVLLTHAKQSLAIRKH